MDAIDRHILRILQQDGRISNQDLADRVGLSPSPCLRRVRKLRKYQAERNAEYTIDVTNLETDIDKLWEALPDFRSIPEMDAVEPMARIADQTRH